MNLEVHTFDPELLCILMNKQSVPEGCTMTLGDDAVLTYRRTFRGRVKQFPSILHFEVDLISDRGACHVVEWLFEVTRGRNVEKIMVDYQNVKMDAEQMRSLLDCGR